MDWQQISTVAGSVAPLGIAVLGYANRHWLSKTIVPKIVLASENANLRAMLVQAHSTNESLLAQATGWRGAAEAGAFTRHEAEELMDRMKNLELYVPKFEAAIVYVSRLHKVILSLEAVLRRNNLVGTMDTPEIPELIRVEIENVDVI